MLDAALEWIWETTGGSGERAMEGAVESAVDCQLL